MRSTARGASTVRVAALLAAIGVVGLLAWRGLRVDPAELSRQAELRAQGGGLPTLSDADAPLSPDQTAALVGRCRDAARSEIWPGRVTGFDNGAEPASAAVFGSRRGDGLLVVHVAHELPTSAVGFEPLRVPLGARVGVSGEVKYKPWPSDTVSSRRYFCELGLSGASVDVKAVSIEIVR